MNYREAARDSLERAVAELESGEDHRLRYAALELRMAMEALTYDRASGYLDELPPGKFEVWQPKRLLLALLELDPNVDTKVAISMGLEESYGTPPPESKMQNLGTDSVLSLSAIKGRYEALGSFLHVQTIQQQKQGKPVNFTKIRERCEEIAGHIEAAIESPIFNVRVAQTVTFDCIGCQQKLTRKFAIGVEQIKVECFHCPGVYTVQRRKDSKVAWIPHQTQVTCVNKECSEEIGLWNSQVKAGTCWTCSECGAGSELKLYVVPEQA